MLRLKNQLRLTAVVVTHDLDLMRRVADKVVVLDRGRIVEQGTYQELLQQQQYLWKYHQMQYVQQHAV